MYKCKRVLHWCQKQLFTKHWGTLSTRRHRFVLIQIIVAELETVLIGSTEIYLLCSEVTHLGINPTQSHILAVVQKIYWKNSTWFFISISVCNDLHLGSSKVSDLSSIEDWCGMMGVRLQSDWSKSVSSFLSSRKIAATTSCQMIKAAELWLYSNLSLSSSSYTCVLREKKGHIKSAAVGW